MSDLLVKLYELPALEPVLEELRARSIVIRRAIAPEKHVVTAWIGERFSAAWVSEAEIAFAHQPVGCFIATRDARCVGFACYDSTGRGFFGPEGVDEKQRGRGIGKGLLLACLHDMRAQGYGYAIIGWAGPVDFYARTVGATVIEGSKSGIYAGMLSSP